MASTFSRVRRLLLDIGRIIVLFLSLTYGAVLVLQLLLFYATPRNIVTENLALKRLQFTFLFLTLTISLENLIFIVLLCIWLVYVGCFIIAWLGPRRRFLDAIGSSRSDNRLLIENTLFVTVLLSSMVHFVTWMIWLAQQLLGIPIGTIHFQNQFVALINLSVVPIIEELVFRLLFIGVPAVIHLIWFRRQIIQMPIFKTISLLCYALVFPGTARRELEVRVIGRLDYVTVLVSALLFGIAHISFGAGWEIGMISISFVAGVIYSLAYLEYGFHVPLLLHWFFNSYWICLSMINRLILIPGVELLYVLLFFTYIVIGFFSWVLLVVGTLSREVPVYTEIDS